MPTGKLNKKLCAAFESEVDLSRSANLGKVSFVQDNESDSNDSNYEDCTDTLSLNDPKISIDDDSLENDNSQNQRAGTDSATKFNPLLAIKRLSNSSKIRINLGSRLTEPARDSSFRKSKVLSANYLITKLIQNNDNLTQRLSETSSADSNLRLIKLLPFRTRQLKQQLASSGKDLQKIASMEQKSPPSKSISEESSQQQQSISGDSIETTKSSITQTNMATSPKQQQTSSSGSSAGQKRRRDLSLSASLDDALSIIEEKNDDDQLAAEKTEDPQQEEAMRMRLSSSASTKHRPMIRSKKIELSDDSDLMDASIYPRPAKASSVSSVDDEGDIDDNAHSSSTTISSILGVKSSHARSESILSSSTQSTSMLTEETVRAAKSTSPVESKLTTTTSQADDGSQRLKHLAPRSESVNFQSDSRMSPETRHANGLKSQLSIGKQPTSFIQTVRTIKAEQRLLQKFVKQQNQNLNPNVEARMKNIFVYPNRVHQSEYPFVTLKKYPDKMIQCTGGVVSVHSVKLLDHIINDEESETRDIWWTEIRKEIRSHAKALNCNTIIGYSETSKVINDVCILSACGTAAVLKDPMESDTTSFITRKYSHHKSQTLKVPRVETSPPPLLSSMPKSKNSSTVDSEETSLDKPASVNNMTGENDALQEAEIDCSFCHTSLTCVDSISSLTDCTICKSSKVPDVLLLTIEPPQNMNIASVGTLVQARVCRIKRDLHGETSAKEIGDALPFLEYELHRQLFSKLKFKGMNCLFNLSIVISVGENMITGIATGTGCFVIGLPTPDPPQISAGKGIKASKLSEIQGLIAMCAIKNREKLGLDEIQAQLETYCQRRAILNRETPMERSESAKPRIENEPAQSLKPVPGTSSNFDPDSNSDLYASGDSSRNKILQHKSLAHKYRHSSSRKRLSQYQQENHDQSENVIKLRSDDNNIVLEVDDNEDADIIALLIDSDVPEGYLVCNSESVPSVEQGSITSINMFTQVMRSKLIGVDQFAQQFDWILQALFVKLRRSLPCCLTNLNFVVDLPEAHIVQISITGCLLGLGVPPGVNLGTTIDVDLTNDAAGTSSAMAGSNVEKDNLNPPAVAATSSSVSTSTSISSSSSSASPTSSSESTLRSSTNSSSSSLSVKSIKEASKVSGSVQVSEPAKIFSTNPVSAKQIETTQAKSLTKKISSTNIAALLRNKRNKSNNNLDHMELVDVQKTISDEPSTTKATIAAVKQKIQNNRLGYTSGSGLSFRPVLKKQQTYPGANSPAISGQDILIPPVATTNTIDQTQTTLNSATRKATLILNKVKQPLKDLSYNFNNSNSPSNPSSIANRNGNNQSIINGAVESSKFMKSISSSSNRTNTSSLSAIVANSNTSSNQGPAAQALSSNSNAELRQKQSLSASSSSSINSSIDITSLSYIPGAREYHYLGNLSFSFVRETSSVRENGGLNGFIHCFLMEVYAIVRAHVSALGGNAFLSFRMQQSCIFYHSNKNQAQCLISVAGDAVQIAI